MSGRFRILSLLLALFCFVALADSSVRKREAEEVPVITPEDECSSVGGHCLHVSKCPAEEIKSEGDCPKQKSSGAICCQTAFPADETRCEMLAGECKSDCPNVLTVSRAQNCPDGEICCTLV